MRNSLLWKLAGAFLLVAVVTAGLVALFSRLTNADRLSQLIIDQQTSNLQTALVEYYSENGSWSGIDSRWSQINQQIRPFPDQVSTPAPGDHFDPRRGSNQSFFGLADEQGIVLIQASREFPVGSKLPANVLSSGTPVLYNSTQIGTILLPPSPPQLNSQESQFLQRTNEALLYAILGASVVALILGIVLARTLIQPLQALTRAAQNIARGELKQVVKVTSRDEIGQLAASFNAMSQEVARANALRKQMTADIAHDLRTPLMVISGYIESMRDGVLQPTPERLALIYTQIEGLQTLVSDLRMLSQADAGELPLHPQSLAPKALLESAAAPFAHQAETQHITLAVNAEENLPNVFVDDARMMQVFGNLISNALRYTPEGGTIQLSAESAGKKVVLSVRDNGSGISAEELPYIFDRFYRVDKSRSSDTGETGLGLAIVKALVEAHNATIQVESQPGVFTAFHITLDQSDSL